MSYIGLTTDCTEWPKSLLLYASAYAERIINRVLVPSE